MTNDDLLTQAIRLIKAGNKDAARSVLEPFLLQNPYHIQAWMWETELFSKDRDKIKVLEACLQKNPGDPQVIKALIFFKRRLDSANKPPITTVPTSLPSSAPSSVKFTPSDSSFSTSSYFNDLDASASAPQQTAINPIFFETQNPSQPAPQKRAVPQKKPIRLSPNVMKAILVVLACVAFIAAIGFYLGGGYYLNGQINQSFDAQNCAEIVQQTTFVSLYPRGLFASIYPGHDQFIECRIKLDGEQAVLAKNWGEALSLAQQYLAAYPAGPFAKNLAEQAPKFLSTWSAELIASHNYGTGIEKLKQLLKDFPDSPPAQTASETILQTYILWAKELTDKQDFKEAESLLNTALFYFQAETARSEPIKRELFNLYVAWGDKQVQLGDIENGHQHL